jgi:hypothetical protein
MTRYELDGRGYIPGKDRRFFLVHIVHPGSGPNQASSIMGIRGTFQGNKAAQYVFMAWCLIHLTPFIIINEF